jgi:hypothetical protein
MTIDRFTFRRVSKKRPCEICGHYDWCTSTDSIAFCMRVSVGSFRTSRNGAYMHRTQVQQPESPAVRSASRNGLSRASEEQLDRVYRKLVTMLSLSPAHNHNLRRRGLDEVAIKNRGYRSAPTEAQARTIAARLAPLGLDGIPGFYVDGNRWRLVKLRLGVLVPVRNRTGLIVGIQIRHDDYDARRPKYIWLSSAGYFRGTSSGAPLHWANYKIFPSAGELLVTEGALKGDLIAHFLGVPVIAAAGVTLFGRNFGATLKALYPDVTAIICVDSDWSTKPQVKTALTVLQRQLTAASVPWRVRCWPMEHKGYDDYLLSLFQTEVAA